MIDRGWQRAFDDPILLPGGRKLTTLHDAATFITKLPKREHDAPEWRAAIEAVMVVENLAFSARSAEIDLTHFLHRLR
jgi:hypothetical protein